MKAKNKRPAECMRRVMSKFRPFHRIASPQACATCAFHSLSSKFDYSQCRLLSSMKNSPLRLKSMLANQGQVFPRPGLGKTVGFMDSLLPCNEISVTYKIWSSSFRFICIIRAFKTGKSGTYMAVYRSFPLIGF